MRTSDLAKITRDYAEAGQGLKSDADRTATELALLQTRQLAAHERQLVASTRLARALSIPSPPRYCPKIPQLWPLDMLQQSTEESSLIATGLSVRPELKESQALVLLHARLTSEKSTHRFVPSVLLGFSTTSFGGGLGNNADNLAAAMTSMR